VDTFYDLHFAKHLTDVQTDVHFVPIDSTSYTPKVLVLLMSQRDWCSISA